ncbi:hypothetical protein [Flavobacterium covae]|uniref:hypothetical protein n=1 Tax=Flavobacterium covae TaxID=2906076 RepID=UPI0035E460D5
MQKINYPKDIERFKDEYYKKVIASSKKKFILNGKIDAVNEKLKEINPDLTFEKLLTASFFELINYEKEFENYIQCTVKNELLDKYNEENEKGYIEFLLKKRNDNNIKWKDVDLKDANEKENWKKKMKELNDVYKKELCSILGGIKKILYENNTIHERISEFFMENIKSQKKEDGLNLKTCFYCNIDFINVFQAENGKNKNHYTLDHIFSKNKYPFFSISLFNLVPCCSPCNSKFKLEKEFKRDALLKKIIPSSEQYILNELIEFRLKDAGDFLSKNKEDDLTVELTNLYRKGNVEDNIDKYLSIFQLKERYESHKEKADDILKKRENYSETQINEMSKLLGIPANQIKKDIFGKECFETNNEPFEKYKQDIAKQIGLFLLSNDSSKCKGN